LIITADADPDVGFGLLDDTAGTAIEAASFPLSSGSYHKVLLMTSLSLSDLYQDTNADLNECNDYLDY
jgi:hypothetical protein